ncbi:hypothetical protein E4T50_11203 [Aureobasidium sp. EXF-12298]|nr:hypothetical protein E4T50_11203 [Aureobasidium sp. EXF-12298]KAI4755888.1 hypothetical protein E4T51_11020 [Aureobasidium sp. EXF-12344]KAI4773011.1 hypothetical protein E4T52_11989 [Aureobasidium sp. EXF-3400]
MAKKAKSRTIAVRLISMALTGYYKTLVRPRQHRPLSMLKYDPVELRKKEEDQTNEKEKKKRVGYSGTGVQIAKNQDERRDQGLIRVLRNTVKKKVLFLEAKRGGSK